MIVHWYSGLRQGTIFGPNDFGSVARLDACHSIDNADERLAMLGWRRREAWRKTEWGYEAKLRRR